MKGDYTRFTFDPKKHYTGVFKQQGRVDLDADWNEYVEIQEHLRKVADRDIIGLCGVPEKDGGFKISGKEWTQQPSPVTNMQLKSVHFIDRDHGWIVGIDSSNNAIILTTDNGGVKWTKHESPITGALLHGVDFIDRDHGWIVGFDRGNNAVILTTDNGGVKWTKQKSPVTEAVLNCVDFVDRDYGWIVGIDRGDNVVFLTTENGGVEWTKQKSPVTEAALNCVHFVDRDHGWIVGFDRGNNAVILTTDNGGVKWTKQKSPVTEAVLNCVDFVDQDHGWIVGFDRGNNAVILTTDNGGVEWTEQTSPLTKVVLYSIDIIDQDHGWIVGFDSGDDAIILTIENVDTWTRKNLEISKINPSISSGRIYVDGIIAELTQDASYHNQPDFPNPPLIENLKEGNGNTRTDLAYLDVWQRHITAIEDPEIREKALGGPDTATRLKTVAQVKILEDVGDVKCESKEIPGWPPAGSGGRLSASADPEKELERPCDMPSSGGYSGLENRLYRVEIHIGGDPGTATFKWSRDNGSVVFPVEEFSASTQIKLKRLGRDQTITLHKGDWVEISDDVSELSSLPGTMAQVFTEPDQAQLIITLDRDISGYSKYRHAKVRRWDSRSDQMKNPMNGEIYVNTSSPIELEDGVKIKFSGTNFKTAGYWVFAARTTGEVETLIDAPPKGIEHHYCKLAFITWEVGSDSKITAVVHDCRKTFPPLTELNKFFYVGGDGQEAMPGEPLDASLQVGVSNGQWPVENAHIKFEMVKDVAVADGLGKLCDANTNTGSNGIASCIWTLGKVGKQRVMATLRDSSDNQIGLPIFFNAALRNDAQGSCYTVVGKGGRYQNLEIAFSELKYKDNICICLLEGEHRLSSASLREITPGTHLVISGCSPASCLIIGDQLIIEKFGNVSITGLTVKAENIVNPLSISSCDELTIRNCSIFNKTNEGALLQIYDVGNIVIEKNHIVAHNQINMEMNNDIMANLPLNLFNIEKKSDLRKKAQEAALKIVESCDRTSMINKLKITWDKYKNNLSNNEGVAYDKLFNNLGSDNIKADAIASSIIEIFDVAKKSHPRVALILHDGGYCRATIADNEIDGIFCLYGSYSEEANAKILEQVSNIVKTEQGQECQFDANLSKYGFSSLCHDGGSLWLHRNILTTIRLGYDAICVLESLNTSYENDEPCETFFRHIFLTDNLIMQGLNNLLAEEVRLNSNRFYGDLESGPIGFIISDLALYIGNSARFIDDNPGFDLYSICRRSINPISDFSITDPLGGSPYIYKKRSNQSICITEHNW